MSNLFLFYADEWPTESSAVPAEVIVDMWETAGIPNSRSLLDSLGFQSNEIRISQLSLAIDDDLQASNDESTATPLLRVCTLCANCLFNIKNFPFFFCRLL